MPLLFWLILALARTGTSMLQEPSQGPARELAAKILEFTGSAESIHVVVQNKGRGGSEAAAAFQRELENALKSLGIRLGPASEGTAEVVVTMSENFQGSVWIAEISKGEGRNVAMVSSALPSPAAEKDSLSPVLQVRPVFEQKQPILDLIRRDSELIVLDPYSISTYHWGEGWQIRRSAPLVHPRPWPRDPRGRLIVEGSTMLAYLPGVVCRGSTDRSSVDCTDTDAAWPLDLPDSKLAEGRNYFRSAGLPPFFSAVRDGSQPDPRSLITALDGKAYLYSQAREVLAIFDGWGSDLAVFRPGCGESTLVLAVLPGENDQPDSIQVFKLADRRAAPAGMPAQLPGTVTALWPAAGGAAAVLVCHNSQAKRYEAFQVSVSCDR